MLDDLNHISEFGSESSKCKKWQNDVNKVAKAINSKESRIILILRNLPECGRLTATLIEYEVASMIAKTTRKILKFIYLLLKYLICSI